MTAMTEQQATEWSLPDEARQETVNRLKWNIAGVAFSRGVTIPEDVAESMAVAAEKKAHIVARVESRTTTGVRPAIESLKAYTRKLSQLAMDAIANYDAKGAQAAGGAQTGQGASLELDLAGDREFLTHESAEEALAPLLAPGAAATRVRFSTKSIGADAAAVAARALQNVAATLTHADLSDVIAGRPEDEALATLRTLSGALRGATLHDLNLSDNALGEKGLRACKDALTSQTALEGLALQNVGCSVKACAALDELLSDHTALKKLHLYNNMSGDEGACSIARIVVRSPAMEDFKMVSSRVGPEGGAALARALAAGGALVRLDLHDNPMTADVAPLLAAALPCHGRLRFLNLNDTSLGDEGVAALAAALAGCAEELEEIELALNEVTAAAAAPLAAALARKRALRVVNLRENELEDKGACIVANALAGHPTLATLDLCSNQVRRAGAMAAGKCAVACGALELLALDENEVPEDAVEKLQAVLKAAGKAGVLGPMDENMPEEDEGEEVEEEEEEEGPGGGEDGTGLAAALAKTL